MKIVFLTFLVASTQARRPSFDAIREAGNRMVQRKLTLCGKITGLSLIDAETSTKLADLVNGTVFDMSGMTNPTFNINASYTGSDIASVKFGHNGNPNVHTENFAWYSFCGNNGKNFDECSSLGVGDHTVTAIPYFNRFAGGEAGAPYTVSFSLVSGKNMAAAPVTVPAPTPVTVPTAAQVKPLIPVPLPVPVPAPVPAPVPIGGMIPPPSVPSPSDTIYEPELIALKLFPSRANVTAGPATVEVMLVFKDDGIGFSEISLKAERPYFSSSISGLCSYPLALEEGIGCNISLSFPPYIAEENYTLSVTVFSLDLMNYDLISTEQLEEQSLPHFIEVVSNPDTTPPILLDFDVLSPTIVNVTSVTSATVDLEIVLQDDLSGLGYGYVQVFDSVGMAEGNFHALTASNTNFVAGQPTTFNVGVSFDEYTRPGLYTLQLTISDVVGYTAIYNLSNVEVVNSGYDGSPPQLLGFVAISSTSVNVTSEPGTVEMQLLLKDNSSGVESVFLQATSPEGLLGEINARSYIGNQIAGQSVTVNFSLAIPRYTQQGKYELSLDVSDARGNTVSYRPDQLANRTFPSFIEVINGVEDFTPPTLVNLVALTPTTVNASSAVKSVMLQVVALDNTSGIVDTYVNAYDGGSSSLYWRKSGSYYQSPIVGKPATFNITLEVEQSTRPGRYTLDLMLYDAAKNSVFLKDELKMWAMPYYIEVINPEYDGAPPTVEDVVLLSSAKVNVTLTPAVLDVQVVVRDEISGFNSGVVELWSYRSQPFEEEVPRGVIFDPDTGLVIGTVMSSSIIDATSYYFEHNVSHATFAADKKLDNESFVFNISLSIPQYVAPGKYALQLYLDDYAGNAVYFDKSQMMARSFLYEIQVDNLVVDWEPPVLVNFTALTPLDVNMTSGPATIMFQVTVQDALSGVYFGYVGIHGSEYKYSRTTFEDPIVGKPVVFNASFILDSAFFGGGLYEGTFDIEIGVSDRAGRQTSLSSKRLISLGFPGTFAVV